MLLRLYRRLRQGVAIRRNIRNGSLKVGKSVTFSPDFQMKFQGTRNPQLVVGNDTHLAGRFVVRGKGRVSIGSHCHFHEDSYFGCLDQISIGDHVFAAEGIFVVDNNNHPVDPALRREMTRSPMGSASWLWTAQGVASAPVRIEDNVWLGRDSVLMKGVRIGEGSIVALRAVVTRGVPAYSVVAGNPGRVVKTLNGSELGSL